MLAQEESRKIGSQVGVLISAQIWPKFENRMFYLKLS